MRVVFGLIRYAVRTAVLALAAYLAYVFATKGQGINIVALSVLYLILALVFLGTFAVSLEVNKGRVGGNGMPPYLTAPRMFFGVAILLLISAAAGVVTGQTYALSRYSSKLISRLDDPVDYWTAVAVESLVGGMALMSAFIARRRQLRSNVHAPSKPDQQSDGEL